jgi:predicted anti-sigma-YlaC factor YlaD
MSCERTEHDALRYIDGEMSGEEAADFEAHLSNCKDCRGTVQRFKELKSITGRLKMKDPTDEFWDSYWKSLYRRMERRVAWIFIAIGGVMFVAYAVYEIIRSFNEFTWDKVALAFVMIGVLLLLISVVRERMHQYRVDRYKDVER